MSEYEKPYKILFNAITDALRQEDIKRIKGILILAQLEAEEEFINFEEDRE